MFSSKLLRNSTLYFSSQLITSLVGFLILPILTRFLTPEEYGTIGMFLIFTSFASTIIGLSTHGSINVNYFRLSKTKLSQYITNCLLLIATSTLTCLFLIMISGQTLSSLIGLPVFWLYFGILTTALQYISTIRLTLWLAQEQAKKYAFLEIFQAISIAVLSIVLIAIFHAGWQGRIWSIGIVGILLAVLSLHLLYKDQFLTRPKNTSQDWSEALKFGFPLIPHAIGGFIIYSTDRIILNAQLNLASVGIYMIALQFGQIMSMVSSALNNVLAPWLMRNLSSNDLDKHKIVLLSYCAMLGLIVSSVIGSILLKMIVPLLLSEDYIVATNLIIYICLGYAFTGCYYIVTNYIFYTKKTKHLATITFICAIVNIPITYKMVELYSLEGAAISFLLIQIIYFVLTWILSSRIYPMPWFSLKSLKFND